MGLASEGAQLIDSGLSTEVVEIILHSRAPSMRKLNALKWKVFTSWCSDHQLDPVNCPVSTVLEFLQYWFTAGLAPFTEGLQHLSLKVPRRKRYTRGSFPDDIPPQRNVVSTYGQVIGLLLSECGPGKAQFALPSAGIRCLCQVKSSHLYLYSAFNNTNCNKALHNIKIGKLCQ